MVKIGGEKMNKEPRPTTIIISLNGGLSSNLTRRGKSKDHHGWRVHFCAQGIECATLGGVCNNIEGAIVG